MYVHTVGHAHLFSSVPAGLRLLCSVEEQATLLRGGLEEGGVHTDWATDWVQWSHSYRNTLGTHDMHTHWKGMSLPPHLHHSYLCPPPPPLPFLTLFDLWGSLISGPAGLLLDVNAGAEW